MDEPAAALSSPVPLPAGRATRPGTRSRRQLLGAALAGLAVANAAVIVWIWLHAGGLGRLHGSSEALTGTGRLAALLGAYLALLAVLLLARVPVLERLVGFDRLTGWHRHAARLCVVLLLAHAVLATAGLAVGDRVSLPDEARRLITQYPGVITATAALALLLAVALTSMLAVRRRLRYESWYFVHLYTYLAIALAFSHQIATGKDFVGDSAARLYWTGLYVFTLGALVVFRIAAPLVRGIRHRLRVADVTHEAPGVLSIAIVGRRLERLRARPGQFFLWRFLTRDRWWEAHPFSLSAAPNHRELRITVKECGDFTAGLRALRPGTRVLAEGPFGAFTEEARRRPRVALIAGGAGIAPVRALLETMSGGPGDIVLLYRASAPDELVLCDELAELACARGAKIHYLLGRRGELSAATLTRLVADIAERDVFVCGPPAMVDATQASLRAAGVPRRAIFSERFAL